MIYNTAKINSIGFENWLRYSCVAKIFFWLVSICHLLVLVVLTTLSKSRQLHSSSTFFRIHFFNNHRRFHKHFLRNEETPIPQLLSGYTSGRTFCVPKYYQSCSFMFKIIVLLCVYKLLQWERAYFSIMLWSRMATEILSQKVVQVSIHGALFQKMRAEIEWWK